MSSGEVMRPADWVFAASNGFAVRVQDHEELENLTQVALQSEPEQGVEWIQIQHAQEQGLFVAFDRVPPGWQASADEEHAQLVEDVANEALEPQSAVHLLRRFI